KLKSSSFVSYPERTATLLTPARLGIVTTKTGSFSKDLMTHFGVMDVFEVLIGRENVKEPKPHAEPILKALEQMNVGLEEVWMIGDTRLDIASAQNAGVKSVAVLSGYDTKEELLSLTEFIVDNALDAIKFISKQV
ncbi:HAD-IA family hydrolase, partial [Sulfurimonas sp. MAG313]